MEDVFSFCLEGRIERRDHRRPQRPASVVDAFPDHDARYRQMSTLSVGTTQVDSHLVLFSLFFGLTAELGNKRKRHRRSGKAG